MARRTVVVRRIPGPNSPDQERQEIGRLIDPGDGMAPFGTNAAVEDMLRGPDPAAKFRRYHMGYSNGYTEWLPDKAIEQPKQWKQLLVKLRSKQYRTPEELEAEFGRLYAQTFGG